MSVYTKYIAEPWFTLIKVGIKKCEGKFDDDDFKIMKKGDFIMYWNDSYGLHRLYSVEITDIHYYDTLQTFIATETLNNCFPGLDRIEDAINIYYKISNKEAKKYKIIALCIKGINN